MCVYCCILLFFLKIQILQIKKNNGNLFFLKITNLLICFQCYRNISHMFSVSPSYYLYHQCFFLFPCNNHFQLRSFAVFLSLTPWKVIHLFLWIVFAWLTSLCCGTENIVLLNHNFTLSITSNLRFTLYRLHSFTILFSWLDHFFCLLMTELAWWRPIFPCQKHLPDEGPCFASEDLFLSLVSICLVDIIHL